MITHAFVIVGAGHGILTLFIIEIAWFPFINNDNFTFAFDKDVNYFPAVGLTSLVGQIMILCSMFTSWKAGKNVANIIGLSLLWLSLIYLALDTTKDNYTYLSIFSAIPFTICAIINISGVPLRKFYAWILDK